MSATSLWRGHAIVARGDVWFYVDDGTPVADSDRPCAPCGLPAPNNETDPCWGGLLPAVANACCGHGNREESYIQFTNGVTVRGFVIEYGEAPCPLQLDRPQKAECTQPLETNCKRM